MTKKTEEKLGVMICGHGSRNKGAVGEFARLAEGIRERFPDLPVDYGYLEFANPVIHSGLDNLREQGCTRILAVPGMLFAAGHAKNDIPSVLNTYQVKHPEVSIEYGRELAVDTRMVQAQVPAFRKPSMQLAVMSNRKKPCSWSWAVVRLIQMQTPTLRKSPVCFGKALASAGLRPVIPG